MNKKNMLLLLMLFIFFTGLYAEKTTRTAGNPMWFVGTYLNSAKNLVFSTENRVFKLKFSEGIIGDFRRRSTGLKVYDADVEAHGVTLSHDDNNKVDLRSSTVESLRVNSLEIMEKDLETFMSAWLKKAKNLKINISGGNINISGIYTRYKFDAAVKLYKPANGSGDIGLKIVKLKMGKFGIPKKLANLIIRKDNLLLKRLGINPGIKLLYNNITAENGVLRIN